MILIPRTRFSVCPDFIIYLSVVSFLETKRILSWINSSFGSEKGRDANIERNQDFIAYISFIVVGIVSPNILFKPKRVVFFQSWQLTQGNVLRKTKGEKRGQRRGKK